MGYVYQPLATQRKPIYFVAQATLSQTLNQEDQEDQVDKEKKNTHFFFKLKVL